MVITAKNFHRKPLFIRPSVFPSATLPRPRCALAFRPATRQDASVRATSTSKPARLGGLCGALLAMATGFGLLNLNLPFGKKLIHWSYDLPFIARAAETPGDVRMVYLNDDAHRQLNQPRAGAWDRNIHAQLVERLTAAGARAIVFDIIFSDLSTNAAADDRFARAIQAHGGVILAADYVPAGFGGAEGNRLERPHKKFADAAAGLGITQLTPDEDFEVRRHYHGPMRERGVVLSESWAVARLIGLPLAQDADARAAHRWMNYYGPPLALSATSIRQAIEPDGVPPGYFSNTVVFVGGQLLTKHSGERKDEFRSPWSIVMKGADDAGAGEGFRLSFMPGAEVHATQFLNLLRGDWLVRSPALAELFGMLLVGLGFGWGLVRLRPGLAALIALSAMILVSWIAWLTFTQWHFWFPWLVVVAQIFVAMNFAVVFNSIQLYVQKKLYEQTLALYISPKLVKRFAADHEKARRFLQPGAEKQTLTVVFTDIANFTGISEGMDSNDLAIHMNRYFQQAVTNCVHSTDGTVVKYIGDAIFAFWNAPEAQPDHALRACRAALSFRDQPPQYMNGRLLLTRIGLHTGEANVGNFGSTQRVDYTALGENINLAARMEGLNKYLGTTTLATGETYAAAREQIVSRPCGTFRLKGFERAVEVHELIDPADRAEASRAWREAFADALEKFRRRDFPAAEAAFRRVLELLPDDGPTKFYLHKLDEFRADPPPSDWKGEVELKEK